jgi:hypothetical protein
VLGLPSRRALLPTIPTATFIYDFFYGNYRITWEFSRSALSARNLDTYATKTMNLLLLTFPTSYTYVSPSFLYLRARYSRKMRRTSCVPLCHGKMIIVDADAVNQHVFHLPTNENCSMLFRSIQHGKQQQQFGCCTCVAMHVLNVVAATIHNWHVWFLATTKKNDITNIVW